MKTCNQCGETKPLEAFNKRKASNDGRQSKCRACFAEYQVGYGARNRARLDKYTWQWRRANPDKASATKHRYREKYPQRRAIEDRARQYPDTKAAIAARSSCA